MYLKYYNLKVKPFEISPDPRFLWVGEKHKEGFAALKYAILTGKGFISLTGDVGTGKTTLLNALIRSFDDHYIFARIPDPSLEELDFFNITASAFEMNKRFSGKGEFLSELSVFLNNSDAKHKETVLIIDEAQRIKQELLEEIRLISNIEKPEKKLITIIFAGQSNFIDILNGNRALRNRLAFNYKIESLTELETEKYIAHRLNVAGSASRIFSSSAIHEIYSFAKGNPRQINIICDLAMLYGYTAETRKIEPAIIRECAKRISIPSAIVEPLPAKQTIPAKISRKPIQEKPSENLSRSWKRPIPTIRTTVSRHKAAYLAPLALMIMIAVIGFVYYGDSSNPSIVKLRGFIEQAKNSYAKPLYDAFMPKAQVVKGQTPLTAEINPAAPEKKLNQEKNNSEFATQAALIAGLQKRLQASQAERAVLAAQVEESRPAAALVKKQLQELEAQKKSSASRLAELQRAYSALNADFEKLKPRSEQVAALESALTAKDRRLTQSEQRLQELEKKMAQAKEDKSKLDGEFAAQAALIADLQKKLQASQADQAGLASRVEEGRQAAALLRGRIEELGVQKKSSESRVEKLQTAYNALAADFEKLKPRSEQAAKLEDALAVKERRLAQSEQRLQELEKKMAQAKEDKSKLDGEFAAQAALIADLQKKLQASQAEQAVLANRVEEERPAAVLQKQLQELDAQKKSSESRFAELQRAYDALSADFEKLKPRSEQAAELEDALAVKERRLAQSEQQRLELEKKLAQVKEGRSKLDGEFAAQAALIAGLQKRLQAAQAEQAALADEYNKSKAKTTQLQAQVEELKAQTTVDAPPKSASHMQWPEEQTKAQNPADIIDWVLKKKSQ